MANTTYWQNYMLGYKRQAMYWQKSAVDAAHQPPHPFVHTVGYYVRQAVFLRKEIAWLEKETGVKLPIDKLTKIAYTERRNTPL